MAARLCGEYNAWPGVKRLQGGGGGDMEGRGARPGLGGGRRCRSGWRMSAVAQQTRQFAPGIWTLSPQAREPPTRPPRSRSRQGSNAPGRQQAEANRDGHDSTGTIRRRISLEHAGTLPARHARPLLGVGGGETASSTQPGGYDSDIHQKRLPTRSSYTNPADRPLAPASSMQGRRRAG